MNVRHTHSRRASGAKMSNLSLSRWHFAGLSLGVSACQAGACKTWSFRLTDSFCIRAYEFKCEKRSTRKDQTRQILTGCD